MLCLTLAVLLQAQTAQVVPPVPPRQAPKVEATAAAERCLTVGESPDARVSKRTAITPGPPPLLSFRYFEGKLHHRFDNMDLMLDDAGH